MPDVSAGCADLWGGLVKAVAVPSAAPWDTSLLAGGILEVTPGTPLWEGALAPSGRIGGARKFCILVNYSQSLPNFPILS